jgi:gas vesicle protein
MMNGIQRNFGFFLLGAAIGGAAVALTTPVSGRRMRRMIRKEVRAQMDRGSKQVTRTADQIRTAGQKMYARGEELWQKSAGGMH